MVPGDWKTSDCAYHKKKLTKTKSELDKSFTDMQEGFRTKRSTQD